MCICINCNKRFNKPDERNSGKYCCRVCYETYRSNPKNSVKNKICEYCSCKYHATRYDQRFCCSQHFMQWRYANGFTANTENAHEAVRKNGFPEKRGKLIPQLHNTEVYKKISQAKMGEGNAMHGKVGSLHHGWSGGKNKILWKSVEYQRWRKAVMRRDHFTCQECGDNQGGNLEVDHIKPRFLFPELIFDIDNGRILCKDCHKHTKSWGYKVRLLSRQDF